LHGGIGERAAGDIDLWIDEANLSQIHQLLLKTGHSPKTSYAELSPHYQELYRKRKFHIGFLHRSSGISVELHWRIGGTKPLFPLTFSEAYRRSRPTVIAKTEYRTLNNLDNLLFLHIHAARHLWERLFWLHDLAVFHQSPSAQSIEEVVDLAKSWRIDRPVLAGLMIVQELFDLEIPETMPLESNGQKLVQSGFAQLYRPLNRLGKISSTEALLSNWRMHPGWPHRKAVLADWLSAPDDWHRLPLPDHLVGLYSLARPYTRLLRERSHK
ncbi:MAG: nucleotidyltransferase family protein, partial [Verrucomicrobiota bacterium]